MLHIFPFTVFREKPRVVKPTGDANDGPEAKKAKVDPNETTMVKKVSPSQPDVLCYIQLNNLL